MTDRPDAAPPAAPTNVGGILSPGVVTELPPNVPFTTVEVGPGQNPADVINKLNVGDPLPISKDFKLGEDAAKSVPIESLDPTTRAKLTSEINAALQQAQMAGIAVPADQTIKFLDEPEPAPVPAAPPAAVTQAKKQFCHNCGWDQERTDIVTITEADKKIWLRHLLSGDRFSKTYSVYGGRVELTLRSRRMSELDLIEHHLDVMREADLIQSGTKLILKTTQIGAIIALASVRLHNGPDHKFPEVFTKDGEAGYRTTDNKPLTDLWEIRRKIMGAWSDSIYGAIMDSYIQFDLLCSRLQTAARDEDFFEKLSGAL